MTMQDPFADIPDEDPFASITDSTAQPEPVAAPEPQTTQQPAQPGSQGSFGGDIFRSYGAGSNALLKLGGDLYGLTTGDMDNWASNQGRRGIEFYSKGKSTELKAAEAYRKEKIDAADGLIDKAGTAFWETISSGRLTTSFILEQAPMLAITGGAGAAAGAGAKAAGYGTKAAGQIATGTAVGTGATMQGADVGGDAYEKLNKIDDEVWAKNKKFQDKVSDGSTPEQAKHDISLELSQDAAISSAVMSGVLSMIPGARILDKKLAGVKSAGGSRLAGAAKGFVGEGLQEAGEESFGQLASNVSEATIDPEKVKDIGEGVGEAAGMGFMSGLFGGAAGAATSPTKAQASLSDIANAGTIEEAIAAASSMMDEDITIDSVIDADIGVEQEPIIDIPAEDIISGKLEGQIFTEGERLPDMILDKEPQINLDQELGLPTSTKPSLGQEPIAAIPEEQAGLAEQAPLEPGLEQEPQVDLTAELGQQPLVPSDLRQQEPQIEVPNIDQEVAQQQEVERVAAEQQAIDQGMEPEPQVDLTEDLGEQPPIPPVQTKDQATLEEEALNQFIDETEEGREFDEEFEAGIEPEPALEPDIKPSDPKEIKDSDTIMQAIAKLGGVNKEESIAQGIDPESFKRKVGPHNAFRPEGMTYDQMAEALSERGYMDEKYTANELVDKIQSSLAGERQYTPKGQELAAEQAFEQESLDLELRALDEADETVTVEHALAQSNFEYEEALNSEPNATQQDVLMSVMAQRAIDAGVDITEVSSIIEQNQNSVNSFTTAIQERIGEVKSEIPQTEIEGVTDAGTEGETVQQPIDPAIDEEIEAEAEIAPGAQKELKDIKIVQDYETDDGDTVRVVRTADAVASEIDSRIDGMKLLINCLGK